MNEKYKSMNERYVLTEDTKKILLDNAIIVFDSSALLNLYFYSPKAQGEIVETIIKRYCSRMWIPSHVCYEFCKNKVAVQNKIISLYRYLIEKKQNDDDSGYVSSIKQYMEDMSNKELKMIEGKLKTLVERTSNNIAIHPYIDRAIYGSLNNAINELSTCIKKTTDIVNDFKSVFENTVEEKSKEIEQQVKGDFIGESVGKFLKIGDDYNFDEKLRIAAEGRFRYDNQIPPGYLDEKEKTGMQVYGDLFVWKQIIEYAKKEGKPVILVSNDTKEDWMVEKNGSIPRHELIDEFYSEVGQPFWKYSLKDFINVVNSSLNVEISKSVLDEINNMDVQDYEDWILNDNNMDAIGCGIGVFMHDCNHVRFEYIRPLNNNDGLLYMAKTIQGKNAIIYACNVDDKFDLGKMKGKFMTYVKSQSLDSVISKYSYEYDEMYIIYITGKDDTMNYIKHEVNREDFREYRMKNVFVMFALMNNNYISHAYTCY